MVLNETNMLGYWQPQDSRDEAYEFYGTALDAALQYAELTGPMTGRIFKGGEVSGLFYWTVNGDGSVTLNKVEPSCSTRPLDKCASIGTTKIEVNGKTLEGSTWLVQNSGSPRVTPAAYNHPKLDLSTLPQGTFLMNAADLFAIPTAGLVADGKISIQTQELGRPVLLSANLPAGPVDKLEFPAGEATALLTQAEVPAVAGPAVAMPVKVWLDKVVMTAGANNGFILSFEMHRKVQPREGVDLGALKLADFEKTRYGTDAFGRIASYVHGPAVQANQTYYTMLPFLFDQNMTVGGAGNVIQFLSPTDGFIAHYDLHGNKYSEGVPFNWQQAADGTLTLTLAAGPATGLPITARFVKQVNGGHQVVFSVPDPVAGTLYSLSDFVPDAPSTVTAATLPGKYVFDSTDGMTKNTVTFHKDGTVSGVVGGHWFIDNANGDVVSFECTDLSGKDLNDYQACLQVFDSEAALKQYSFAHIRRMKFMHGNNGAYQVRYDSVFYGARFDILNRDYAMVAWTYRFNRVGNE